MLDRCRGRGSRALAVPLPQEIRADTARLRDDVQDLAQRVDGDTLTLNVVAGAVHDHGRRIAGLEPAR